MNPWTTESIELANQRNYLDQLFRVYGLSPGTVLDTASAKGGFNSWLRKHSLGVPLLTAEAFEASSENAILFDEGWRMQAVGNRLAGKVAAVSWDLISRFNQQIVLAQVWMEPALLPAWPAFTKEESCKDVCVLQVVDGNSFWCHATNASTTQALSVPVLREFLFSR